jgi:hypothetical protein
LIRKAAKKLRIDEGKLRDQVEEACNRFLDDARRRQEQAASTAAAAAAAETRPRILITTEEDQVNDQAVEALTRDRTLYQRGGWLVRVTRDDSPSRHGVRRPFAPRIEPLPRPVLQERLAAAALWVTPVQTDGGTDYKPAHPPPWCVAAVHARGSWRGLRHLEAIAEYPVLRPDGTILDAAGYDAGTGLLLAPAGHVPAVPPDPTVDDARRSRDLLLDVVCDVPFERPCHKAAWLAALLTPLARFAFTGPAPLFLADSNVRGSGKGLILDCISRIVTGVGFAVATYTNDEDELRKRITALVQAGDRLALFDNLEGKFGNATLDAALTATAWKDRLLGGNRTITAPVYVTWFGTGNNVAVGADTARRVCPIRLETPLERPEERHDFKYPDLLGWVDAHRGDLLAAALTVLRAYFAAGCPDQKLTPWGTFGGWSRVVRSAVVWVGLPDPAEGRVLLQARSDTVAAGMKVLLRCWERMDPGGGGLTAACVVERLFRRKPADPPLLDWEGEMRGAIEELVGRGDSRLLGYKLRAYRRRVFDGRYLDRVGQDHQAAAWAVYSAADMRGGEDDTNPPGKGDAWEGDDD